MIKKVFFKNSKGNNLCGVLSNPSSDKVHSVIILCHGFSTNKDSKKYVELEKKLNEHNISVFRFDFFGRGESEGKQEDITITEAVNDILNALKFLKEQGYERIGLFGSSFGGGCGLIAASRTNDFYVLVLRSPVSDYIGKIHSTYSDSQIKLWKENGIGLYKSDDGTVMKLNYAFYEDAKKNDGYEAAQKIFIPTLIMHGDLDKSVPVEQSIKTSSIIKGCKFHILKGADHNFTNEKDLDKMNRMVVDFIIENS